MSDQDVMRIRRPPPEFRRARVAAVADRTPRLRTVTLEGPHLVGFEPEDPAASARLLVPRDGRLEIPVWDGNEFLFADGSRPPIRTVTPLRADPAAGRLDVEVVRHGAGPLSEWAATAETGDEVAVSGPGKGYPVDPTAERFLLAGDESALPAIGELLEAVPHAAAVHVIVELSHPDARLDLPAHPGATVEWLDRPVGAPLGDALVPAVAARSVTADERVWAAGEAAVVQRIRRHLFEELGLPRSQAVVRGYWKRDRAETGWRPPIRGIPRGMSPAKSGGESRDGVPLTNLDQPLFDGADATKRDLVDYLDGVSQRILPVLADRPLSVIRVHRGQEAFMQKNVPKGTPEWVRTVELWAETSKRQVSYALCNDRRTLLWFANQRAVEYHPTLMPLTADGAARVTHLVLDLDPPEGESFPMAVAAARLVRQALADLGLEGAVKTSGAKGVHVYVPVDDRHSVEEAAAATRAIAERAAALDPDVATTEFVKEARGGRVFVDSTRAGGATVVAAYSPRVRPGVPVSFPVGWDDLEDVSPRDFTIHTALDALGDADPWTDRMPAPQVLSAELIAEGGAIPVARVQAMHEGKRRARERRQAD